MFKVQKNLLQASFSLLVTPATRLRTSRSSGAAAVVWCPRASPLYRCWAGDRLQSCPPLSGTLWCLRPEYILQPQSHQRMAERRVVPEVWGKEGGRQSCPPWSTCATDHTDCCRQMNWGQLVRYNPRNHGSVNLHVFSLLKLQVGWC